VKGALSALAVPGALLAVKVTPGARRRFVELRDGVVHIAVGEVAEGGRATEAARVALAEALGLAKTRLVLVRGEISREKVFRVEG
jgi:uncharacterized protein YggU (UPF0235/DUF167 family)